MLLITGDLGLQDHKDANDFNNWLDEQKFDHKIIIPGNHDEFIAQNELLFEHSLSSDCTYLRDELIVIDKIRIYGTPWTPQKPDGSVGAFLLPRNSTELKRQRDKIPDCDILMTHCPPYGVLDDKLGCELLREKLVEMGSRAAAPKVNAFGHIHQSRGKTHGRRVLKGIAFINSSMCNLDDELVHDPIVIKL